MKRKLTAAVLVLTMTVPLSCGAVFAENDAQGTTEKGNSAAVEGGVIAERGMLPEELPIVKPKPLEQLTGYSAKAEFLTDAGLADKEFLADETRVLTCAEAAQKLVKACGFEGYYSEEDAKANGIRDKDENIATLKMLNRIDKDKNIDPNANLTLSDFAAWCLSAAGYEYEADAYGAMEAARKMEVIDETQTNGNRNVTVKNYVEIMYNTVNLPVKKISGYDMSGEKVRELFIITDGETGIYETLYTGNLRKDEVKATPAPQESASAYTSFEEKNNMTFENIVDDLVSLNILTRERTMREEDLLTRAEAAKIICSLLGEPERDAVDTEFGDVTSLHWASGYISYLKESEIINGYPDGSFRPEANVTYTEFQKLLLCALGYGVYCDFMGGYPQGYINYAEELRIVEGIEIKSRDENIPRKDAMRMTENALDVPLLALQGYEMDSWGKAHPRYLVEDGTGDSVKFISLRTRLYKDS